MENEFNPDYLFNPDWDTINKRIAEHRGDAVLDQLRKLTGLIRSRIKGKEKEYWNDPYRLMKELPEGSTVYYVGSRARTINGIVTIAYGTAGKKLIDLPGGSMEVEFSGAIATVRYKMLDKYNPNE